jgi:DNA-binding transcriptional MocR family regulator
MTGTRTVAIMGVIREKIGTRALGPGDRLPSIRRFAGQMGVSPSTVVEAYDRLAAEGMIRAQRGSGFFVSSHTNTVLKLGRAETPQSRAVDPFWVSRQSLDADAAVLKPGCGWLPADWMPHEAVRKALRNLSRSDDGLLADYGGTRGSSRLRRLLQARFSEEGLDVAPEQIMLTASGTQALDLICRLLLRPGDTVVVDDPCYFNFQALLKAHPVRVVSVPFGPHGPDMAVFEALLVSERPRLYVTNSALHNPTGATLSPATAHRLLNAAGRHELTIVEDDIFADFEPEPSVRLATLDGLSRVIRIGSFSKTLSASVRCGYVAARADLVEALVDLQVATNFGGPSPIAADVVAQVLTGGGYRKHMEDLRRRLARARRETQNRLESLGVEPAVLPRGGFYLWCRLPAGRDSTAMAQAALADGVVLAPGNVFSPSQAAGRFMRFNVAHMSGTGVFEAIGRALRQS